MLSLSEKASSKAISAIYITPILAKLAKAMITL
jgi:hypothetical protein